MPSCKHNKRMPDKWCLCWCLVRCAAALDFIDKDKDVIHLAVDHMVVNEVVGHSHSSAGMAYAMAFSQFEV